MSNNEKWPSVRYHCELSITSEETTPEEISELINLAPDRSHKKGDQQISKHSGSIVTVRTNLWAVVTPTQETTSDVVFPQLGDLLKLLETKYLVLKRFKDDTKSEVTLWIWIESEEGGIGTELDPSDLDFFVDVCNRIHISMIATSQ